MAIYSTALAMGFILLMVRNVTAAGAAASLIFLISFALVHWTSLLARKRSRIEAPFQTPWFPAIPVIGGLAYGDGYLMVATDGGIFSFSDLPFLGSLGSIPPPSPVVSVAAFAS